MGLGERARQGGLSGRARGNALVPGRPRGHLPGPAAVPMRLLVLSVLFALSACDADVSGGDACSSGPLEGSRVAACVTGDRTAPIRARIQRTGYGGYRENGAVYFYLTFGSGASTGRGGLDLDFFLRAYDALEAGTYPIAPGPEPKDQSEIDTTRYGTSTATVFLPAPGGGFEVWAVTSGEVVLEVATPDAVEGRFALVGERAGRTIRVEGRVRHEG